MDSKKVLMLSMIDDALRVAWMAGWMHYGPVNKESIAKAVTNSLVIQNTLATLQSNTSDDIYFRSHENCVAYNTPTNQRCAGQITSRNHGRCKNHPC